MLETIGAVRMVSPQGLPRRSEAAARQQQPQAQAVELPRRHAALAR